MKAGISTALVYLPAALLLGLLRFLPRKATRALGRGIGRFLYRWDTKHRRLAESNLTAALGDCLSDAQRNLLARRAFLHFGASFLDFFHLAHLKPEKLSRVIRMEGEEHLRAAHKQGNGILLFTGHYGLWEIAAASINPIVPLHVVARPLDNPYLEKTLLKLRRRLGSQVISKFNASRQILRALRQREAVAILIDQNVLAHEAVFVDFFGMPAATTPGLATFHLRTGAAVVPLFCYPDASDCYRLIFGAPVEVAPTGDREHDVRRITQACTLIIEEQIRTAPEYWFWFHNRWKTRPLKNGEQS